MNLSDPIGIPLSPSPSVQAACDLRRSIGWLSSLYGGEGLGEAGLQLRGAVLDGGERLQLVVEDLDGFGQGGVRRPLRRRRPCTPSPPDALLSAHLQPLLTSSSTFTNNVTSVRVILKAGSSRTPQHPQTNFLPTQRDSVYVAARSSRNLSWASAALAHHAWHGNGVPHLTAANDTAL